MLYFVTWLGESEIIDEQEFEDLFAARNHVYQRRQTYQALGATGARVWNDRATFFQVEWNGGA